MMPNDNPAPVLVGEAVEFPQNGLTSGIAVRATASEFTIQSNGTYMVNWQVSITGPGQLVLALSGIEIAITTVGRDTGTTQIVGNRIIEINAGQTLSVRNPAGSPLDLTVTPNAGGSNPVSASLVITRLA